MTLLTTSSRSVIDRENAYFMFNNAIAHIFRNSKDKDYTIMGHGNSNIIIKTKMNPASYYRICFRAYEPKVIERMRKTLSVIRNGDYGFLLPLESHIDYDYIYYKIRLVDRVCDVTYEELYDILKKLLPLGQYDLAWVDYKPSNLGYVDGKIVIIDFECMDKEDIDYNIEGLIHEYRISKDPNMVKEWLKKHIPKCNIMHPHRVNLLIALVHGFTTPGQFMRMRFNYDLYRKKKGYKYTRFNKDIYQFMMKTPFGLL